MTPIHELHNELLQVFEFLDQRDLWQAAMVCPAWREAATDERFWTVLDLSDMRELTHDAVEQICARHPTATTLNLASMPDVDAMLIGAMRHLRNLQVLNIKDGSSSLPEEFFSVVSLECVVLQKLTVSSVCISRTDGPTLLSHPSLRCLQISSCSTVRLSIRCPQLDSFTLEKAWNLEQLELVECVSLVHLYVSIGVGIRSGLTLLDTSLRHAITNCPVLETLEVSDCFSLSHHTLREISRLCTNIRTLNVSNCPFITTESIAMPNLIELNLKRSIPRGRLPGSADLSLCPLLQVLTLDNCESIDVLSLDLVLLREITVARCHKLVQVTLKNDALTKVHIEACPVLNEVTIISNTLQSLVLKNLNCISNLSLKCIELEYILLSECEVGSDIIEEFGDSAASCLTLRTLIFQNCQCLQHVALASSSLRSLSFERCTNIVSLELHCPVVRELYLDCRYTLRSASLAPVGLLSLDLRRYQRLLKLKIEASEMTSLNLTECISLKRAYIGCPSLLSLDATLCRELDYTFLEQITYCCPSIQSLVLALCTSISVWSGQNLKRLRYLTTLDLSYTIWADLSEVFKAFPDLEILKLTGCKRFGDTPFDALHEGTVPAKLRNLDLSASENFGNISIRRIIDLFPHLSHLKLDGLPSITEVRWEMLSSPPAEGKSVTWALENLSCVACQGIEKVVIRHSEAYWDDLSSINLSTSVNIKEVHLSCSNLTSLDLSYCESLVELQLQCPTLKRLSLKDSGIDDRVLEQAIQGCPLLKSLDVTYCSKVSSAALARIQSARPKLKVYSGPRLAFPNLQSLYTGLYTTLSTFIGQDEASTSYLP